MKQRRVFSSWGGSVTACETHVHSGKTSSERAVNAGRHFTTALCTSTQESVNKSVTFWFTHHWSKQFQEGMVIKTYFKQQTRQNDPFRVAGACIFNVARLTKAPNGLQEEEEHPKLIWVVRPHSPRLTSVAQVKRRSRAWVQTLGCTSCPITVRQRRQMSTAGIWRTDPAVEARVCHLCAESGINADIPATMSRVWGNPPPQAFLFHGLTINIWKSESAGVAQTGHLLTWFKLELLFDSQTWPFPPRVPWRRLRIQLERREGPGCTCGAGGGARRRSTLLYHQDGFLLLCSHLLQFIHPVYSPKFCSSVRILDRATRLFLQTY